MMDWWMRLCRPVQVYYALAGVQVALTVTLALMGSWFHALTALIFAGFIALVGTHEQTIADLRWIEDQYRSQTKPPKPDEPQGLGAVVEDASQVEFVHLGSGLWVYGTTDGPSQPFAYAEIAVVRVLSEGVPS